MKARHRTTVPILHKAQSTTAWMAGTSPAMTGVGLERYLPRSAFSLSGAFSQAQRQGLSKTNPPHRHGRACPGHPRSSEPLTSKARRHACAHSPGAGSDIASTSTFSSPNGVDGRDKPGHDGSWVSGMLLSVRRSPFSGCSFSSSAPRPQQDQSPHRHGRACPGHPRRSEPLTLKARHRTHSFRSS